VTQATAERQLGRVDELAKRLRSMSVLGTVAAASALLLSGLLVLAWLPPGSWARSDSVLPLAVWIGLLAAVILLVGRERRAARGRSVAALVREAETSAGLRAGELAGARELRDAPSSGSRELASLHRTRVATALAAFRDSELVPRQRRRSRRRLGLSVASAGLASLALALTFGLRPGESRAAAVALTRPWVFAFPPPAPPLRLELGDGPVLRGETALLRVHAPERLAVSLNWKAAGEPARSAGIPVRNGGPAVGRTGPVHVDLAVWVEDDDGRSSDTLTVVPEDPLLATELRVITESPGWNGADVDTIAAPIPPLTVESGTVVRVVGRTNHPLRAGFLVPTNGDSKIPLDVSGSRFDGMIRPAADGTWGFELVPEAPVPGTRLPPPLELSVLLDRAPQVRVIRPGRDVQVTTESVVPIVVDASDDVGLRSIDLRAWRVSAAGVKEDRATSRLSELAGEQRWIVQAGIELAPYALAPGDTLFYEVLARDGNPGNRTAVSRTWKITVPSIAELRHSATERTGELAGRAAALAEQTADLRREATEAAAAMTDAGGQPSGFENSQEARAVEQLGREVERRMEELERELSELSEGLESSPAGDPSLARRMEELGELLQELRRSGLAERMRALEEALRNLDRSAAKDALDGIARTAEELERQIAEAADLMQRVATEQALKDAARDAASLADSQQRAAREQQPSAQWAEEERRLADAAEALSERLDEIRQRLESQGADAAADSVSAADARLEDALERMREAAGQALAESKGRQERDSGGQSPAESRSRQAEQAAESLQDAARGMEEASQSLSADWRQEAVDALDGASRQALDLAREQAVLNERLATAGRGRELASRQDAIARGLDQVLERLSEASSKTALVDRRTGPTAARARQKMEELSQKLSDGLDAADAVSEAGRKVAEDLNDLSGRLRASRKAMESAESGTGMEEALEQLARLGEAQAGLNRDAGGLMMLAGSGSPVPMELTGIAERQQRIAERLQELAEQPAASSLPARPGELAAEAAEIARTLLDTGMDPETIRRQERLFRRLLDAGRTLERDPDPERRTSTTAAGRPTASPAILPEGALAGPRYPYPDPAALKRISPAGRRLILDYFDRLNGVGGSDR
jgi:hypothetical protein